MKDLKTITRVKPRVSINKLGEYLSSNASPARRKKIIHDAKYPPDFIVKRYSKAESAIKDFYLDDDKDTQILHKAIHELSKQKPANKYQFEARNSCIEALDNFIDFIYDTPIFDADKDYQNGINDSAKVTIAGTEISVRPELLIFDKGEICGAVKLYFSKTYPLSRQGGEFIGALLKHFLETEYETDIKPRNCFVIDVFSKNIILAPNAHKKRLNDIEAACEEIASRWDQV